MTVRPILTIGNPELRVVADAVDPADITTAATQTLIDDLIDTMRDANGAGLAATQVGAHLRIAVMDVSDESDGNAVGMGLVDFVPERFVGRVDHDVTRLNALTSCSPTGAKMPVVLPDDREAILAGIQTATLRPEGPRVVYVRDTLELEHVLVSEACRPLVEGQPGIEVISGPKPLPFDEGGRLQSPFV